MVGHLGKDHFLRFKQFFEKTGILFNPRINAALHFIQYTLFTSEWDSKKLSKNQTIEFQQET